MAFELDHLLIWTDIGGDRTGDIFSLGMDLLGCKAMGAALLRAME